MVGAVEVIVVVVVGAVDVCVVVVVGVAVVVAVLDVVTVDVEAGVVDVVVVVVPPPPPPPELTPPTNIGVAWSNEAGSVPVAVLPVTLPKLTHDDPVQ